MYKSYVYFYIFKYTNLCVKGDIMYIILLEKLSRLFRVPIIVKFKTDSKTYRFCKDEFNPLVIDKDLCKYLF